MNDNFDTKTCSACKQTKSISEFGKDKYNLDNLKSQCKACCHDIYLKRTSDPAKKQKMIDTRDKWRIENKEHYNASALEHYHLNKDKINAKRAEKRKKLKSNKIKEPININLLTHKTCKKCEQRLSLVDFDHNNITKDGYENSCKSCRKEQRRKSVLKKQQQIAFGIVQAPTIKKCKVCQQTLLIDSFNKDSSRGDGYETACKTCKSKLHSKYISNPINKRKYLLKSKKWRLENLEHYKRVNKKYYIVHREERLKKNAEYHKTDNGRWTSLICQANYRKKNVSISMSEFLEITSKPCRYCGILNNNGIDRIDSSKGYEINNCAPCCTRCNYMKNALSESEFFNHLRKISSYQETGEIEDVLPHVKYSGNITKDMYLTPTARYNVHKRRARKKGFQFALSYTYFIKYWQKPCHYCGSVINTIGLDRVNNDEGYIPENIVSCCQTCNSMKSVSLQSDFLNHVQAILTFLQNNIK